MLAIALALAVLVLIFAGLRLYGAYHSERENALARATDTEEHADALEAEGKRLDAQNKCNDQWQSYKSALLEKQLAELRGRVGKTPVEPLCTGYAPRLDEALNLLAKAGDVHLEAISTRAYAKYERKYAANRKLQTRYLGLRVWAFLTGTEVKQRQAEMDMNQENAGSLATCLARANKDTKLEATCIEVYGKK